MPRLDSMEMRAVGPIGQSMVEEGVCVVKVKGHLLYDYRDPTTHRIRNVTRSEASKILAEQGRWVNGWHWVGK